MATRMGTWSGALLLNLFLLFQDCQAVRIPIVMDGCGKPNNAFMVNVPNVNPKECLQWCNRTHVGIQNAKCYCGDFDPASNPNLNCNQTCKWEEEDIEFSCGGNFCSVYSRGTIIEEGTNDQSGCVLMHMDQGFRVDNCSRKHSCICGGDAFKDSTSTLVENNWTQCVQSCINENNMFGFSEKNHYCLSIPCNVDRWINAYVYDDCSPNPCGNNGTCINTDFGFNCTCPSGYMGKRCETVSDSIVQPSTYQMYSPSFSSFSTSASITDCSAASPPISSVSLSDSASTDSSNIPHIILHLPSSTLTTITNTIHPSVSSTATRTIHLSSSPIVPSSTASITMSPPVSTLTSIKNTIYPSAPSTPTKTIYLSSFNTASSSKTSTAMTPTAASTPTGTIYLSSSTTASSSVPSTTIPPSAASTTTGTIHLSSLKTGLSSVTSTTMTSTVTSNQSDSVSGWISKHAVIIFPICGVVIVLFLAIIIIICVKMRKMKKKNDELESELKDTPSNSEFDYKTSFSYNQRPDNFNSSYHSGHYTYKEVPLMGPSQQMYLPRVSTRPLGSFSNRDYEDHAL